jgi:hypothetical protein
MKAKDLHFATAIAKAITVDVTQERIVEDHGEYFVLNGREGRLYPAGGSAR